jgi:uncharacterized membrane protein
VKRLLLLVVCFAVTVGPSLASGGTNFHEMASQRQSVVRLACQRHRLDQVTFWPGAVVAAIAILIRIVVAARLTSADKAASLVLAPFHHHWSLLNLRVVPFDFSVP